MGTILVVRHGETNLNKDDKVRGWADVPLNHHGIQEAIATAKLLENWEISQILASDLMRTRQTAQIIGRYNFVHIFYTEYLRSWNSGSEMQGMDLDDAIPRMRYFVAHPTESPQGGESFGGFLQRVRGAWNDIIQRSLRQPAKAVVVVTSSRDIDAFRYFVTDDKRYLDKDNAVTPGQVAQFNVSGTSVKEVPFNPHPQGAGDAKRLPKES